MRLKYSENLSRTWKRIPVLNPKISASSSSSGAWNSWRAAESQTDGVRPGEQTENSAGRGAARGEYVSPSTTSAAHEHCKIWAESKDGCKGGRVGRQTNTNVRPLFAENDSLLGSGMKKELQTLREEIKTLASQIQRKLKSEFVCFKIAFNLLFSSHF